ncbi:NAD(P)H-binding protein [Lactococcus insecticola]|uniref:Flavin reductase n=1 Tax=Pseudolactococcus insecticola TaxID=2709158 RepID=A0A6A0B4Y1_9LACT|nr:NAD(P)H-binding protein [Lactococcus insecticola]GFH40420.1 flavin reductase [Lactococcus insecticola]
MKIAVIGATGQAGNLITEKLAAAGADVTALVRNASRLKQDVPAIEKDIFDLTSADLAPFDVVIEAFRAPDGQEEGHLKAMRHLIDLLEGTQTRLVAVGGTSSLYTDASRTKRYIDLVDPTAPFYPVAKYMSDAASLLKDSQVNFTYFSPASFFDPSGAETGDYSLAGDIFKTNEKGDSYISMRDYAAAMRDVVLNSSHEREHISIYQN